MKQKLIDFYLDWLNNFLTSDYMAEYYGITVEDCVYLIQAGKIYHEIQVETRKNIYG